MAIHGCYHSVRSDINTIKNTLNLTEEEQQERGLMFVLKEIVQNADDCGADRLGFGLSRGLPQANHSLLQGPAIIAVNNGPFHLSDVEGIGAIGLSTKENDSSAVGKFGQGLKTVFLICEAFFYLPGPPGPKVDPGVEPRYMYNPWYVQQNDNPVVSWDSEDFSEVDEQYIIAERQKMGLADGFTLWIPLRQRELCRRRNNGRPRAIVPKFLEDDREWLDREFQRNLANELAELMPLLKGIRRIDLHDGRRLGSVQFTQGSQQCIKSFSQQGDSLPKLKGHIEFSTERFSTEYYGYQKLLSNTDLLALKERDSWPTITAIDDWDEEISDKQKAEPHCAVVLQTRASAHEKSQLIIRWAVFLPTEKAPSGDLVESIPFTSVDGSSQRIVLTLHGFFFLQSDRRQIYGWSKDDNGPTQEWNKILAEQGTLRLLLPTLEDFARERSPHSVKVLTKALQSSDLYKTYRQHICAEGAWLCTLDFNEQPSQLQWHFERNTTARNLLTIPESTFERLPEILPTLAEVCRDRVVTFKEWPRLASSDHRPQSWSPENIGSLLQGVTSLKAAEICTDNDNVEALCIFLTHALPSQQINTPAVSQPLTALLKSAFAVEFFQPADNLSQLVAKLPIQQILGLPSGLPKTLYTRLLRLATECLVVPGNLAPSDEPPQLSEQDAYELLKTLVSEVNNSDAVEQFAIEIFNQVQSPATDSWQKICQLKLFKMSEILSNGKVQQVRSFDWISQRQQENRIFSDRDGTALARSLATALQEPIFLLHTHIGRHHLQVSNCTISSVLASWSSQLQPPDLVSAAEKRVRLLQEILKLGLVRSDAQKVARYLLHANQAYFENVNETLYSDDHQSDRALWSRILRHLLRDDESWKFVGEAFLEILTPQARRTLHIESVDSEGVTVRLQELRSSDSDISSIDWTSFSKEEREEILHQLQLPVDLLRQLCIHEPLHWQPGQTLAVIDSNSYLEPNSNDFKIRPELAEVLGVTLIKRCERSQDIAQKQEQISPPISAREVVERILRRSDQAEYWHDIMNAIRHNPQEVSAIKSLYSSPWLPLEAVPGSKAPEDVIHLKEIQQDELEGICTNSRKTYITSSQLSKQIENHPAIKLLRDRFFPSRKQALDMLAALLLEDCQYHVGSIRNIISNKENLESWLSAFSQVPHDVMPAFQFLSVLNTNEALDLFASLAEPIKLPTRLQAILNSLAHQHRLNTHADLRKSLLETYRWYLNLAKNKTEVIQGIKLLSRTGTWREARDLCIGESIAPQYVLDDFLQSAVISPSDKNDLVDQNTGNKRISETQDTAKYEAIRDYFESWPHRTRKAIGILLRILSGHQPELEALSCQYLQDVNRYLECLVLKDTQEPKFIRATKSTRFSIVLNQESQREVVSLAGVPLIVQILQDLDKLIVGRHRLIQQHEYTLTFQVVPIGDADRLIAILKNTFRYIVENIYGYEIVDFTIFWEKVNLTGIDIRVARHLVLDSGILSLRSQIRLNSQVNPKVVQLIQEYSELQKRKGKLEILGTARCKIDDINKRLIGNPRGPEKMGIRDEIGELLCKDEDTQKIFLEAVIQKIKNASYDENSILFELFQNADDAYCELNNIGGVNISHDIKVGYNQVEKELWLSHWGRRINQNYCSNQVFEDHGYDDDLLKMLLLNFSDKAEGVTGKFGLGFKSVFLASDRPKVVSGTLGLEVIGAVYPRELTREEFDSIERCYLDSNADEGTAIVLPEIESPVAQGVLSFFEERVLYLIAFSRWIKSVTIIGTNSETTYKWSEERIGGISSSEVYYGRSSSEKKSFAALLLGDTTKRCLLGLNKSGFTPLPASCPTFWVTTPTRMYLEVGIAINAPFHPDIGRSQLDLSGGGFETNKALAQELGHEFGQALIQLFKADETNHERLCQALGLNHGVTQMELWGSLWNILGTNLASCSTNDQGIELLKSMFWATECGLELLYRQCDALPTGLSEQAGDFNCLTRISKVKWSVSGALSKSASNLLKVLNWPVFNLNQHRILPGEILSSAVEKSLRCLTNISVKNLDLLRCLRLQLSGQVSPEVSQVVEELITPNFVQSLDSPERQSVEEFLHEVRFQAQDGQWYPARELLVTANTSKNPDEELTAKFAPQSALLAEEYEYGSLALFYVCRGDFQITPKKQGEWILQAEPNKCRHCIQYLIKGQNRDAVKRWVKPRMSNNWLANLLSKRFTAQEDFGVATFLFDALLYELGLLSDSAPTVKPTPPDEVPTEPSPAPPENPPSPDEVLERIFQWWKQNRYDLISRYEDSLYPYPELKLTIANANSANDPQRWLVLFMLGALHTMGRTQPEKHREFIRHCQEWGWLDVMASGTVNEAEWLNLLHDYFAEPKVSDRLKYYQWVRYYPAFYALSRWWQVYRDNFLAANEQMPSVHSLLYPRLNPAFQGSGLGQDAPPLKSILGIGANFVIREFMRSGILTQTGLRSYSYVPVRRVRALLYSIGCTNVRVGNNEQALDLSRSIHNFLASHMGRDKATFLNDFDLPFLMLHDSDEKQQLLEGFKVPQEPDDDSGDISTWMPPTSGDFVTLPDGRVIPRSYMR